MLNREHARTGAPDRAGRFRGRSTDELIVLSLCGLGVIGVTPFLVARALVGDYLLVAVDLVVILGVALIAGLVWVTRRIRLLSLVLSVFYLSVVVLMVNIVGPVLMPWAYPTVTATFFLVPARMALGLSAAAGVGLLPVMLRELAAIDVGTTLMTLALNMTFAYVFAAQTTHQRASLHEQAHRDPLTNAGNRRALEDRLRQLVDLRDGDGGPASLILFDLDHFKRINDAYGHEVGDQVLIEVVDLVGARLRRTDALYRIGGEEFVALVSGSDAARSAQLAEELRARVEANRFTARGLALTVSLGVAEARPGEEPTLWLRRADRALYRAKNEGRNTCRCHDDWAVAAQTV